MRYAVELFFDKLLEQSLLTVWQTLQDAGIPPLSASHSGARPHLSLAVYDDNLDVDDLVSDIYSFADTAESMDIMFQSVATFSAGGGVLFIAPTVTTELLSLHASLYGALESLLDHSSELYRIGRWVPHSTVAMDVPDDRIGQAIVAARNALLHPLTGRITHVGVEAVDPDGPSVTLLTSRKLL